MLILGRKPNERVMIDGGRIVVTVVGIKPDGTVKLGFEAPAETSINREEVQVAVDRDAIRDRPPGDGAAAAGRGTGREPG